MTRRPDPPAVVLAGLLIDGTYARALDIAGADRSPLRSAVGGRGSVGGHSDPTANGPTRHHCPHPVALIHALNHLAYALDAPAGRHADAHWVGGKLLGVHQLGTTTPTVRRWVGDLLTLVNRCVTPAEAAAWAIAQAEERITVTAGPKRVRACEACGTPVAHCGRIRNGWCDACYALSRIWVKTRPELVDDDLALDHHRYAEAVAQAIAAGDLARPWSPHSPTKEEAS